MYQITAHVMANVALIARAAARAAGRRCPGAYAAVGDDVRAVCRAGGHLLWVVGDAAGKRAMLSGWGKDCR